MVKRSLTWCSWADEGGFRGALILEGSHDVIEARIVASNYGPSPGGQMVAFAFDEAEAPSPAAFEDAWANRGRYLTAEEARTIGRAKSIREWDREAASHEDIERERRSARAKDDE